MPKGFYRDLCKILKMHGFSFYRMGKGSHEIWWNEETKQSLTVPENLKSRHTANAILKQANISQKL